MRRRKRIFLWASAVILLLPVAVLLGIAVLARVLYPWPDPVPGVRLEPLRPPLPDNQIRPDNAFYYFRQFTEIRYSPATELCDSRLYEFRSIGWEAGRYPACVQRLTEIAPNLKLFEQAAAAPTAQAPVTHWDSSILWTYTFREIAGLLAVDAEHAAAENRWEDAAKDLRITLRNTVHATRGGYFLRQVQACVDCAAISVRRLALERNPPPAWLREMLTCLQDTDLQMDPSTEEMRHERLRYIELPDLAFAHLAALPGVARYTNSCILYWFVGPDAPPPTRRNHILAMALRVLLPVFGSSPERSRRHLDAVYTQYLSSFEGNAPEKTDRDKVLGVPRRYSWSYWLWFLNDPVGRVFVLRIHVPDLRPRITYYSFTWQHRLTNLRAATLTCAIRLYQAEHDGRLPATLAALTPQYLARLPADPFAPVGTPYGYCVNPDGTFVLWSRGPDRVDNGGRHNIDWVAPEDDEPVPPGDGSSQVSGGPRFRDKYRDQRDYLFAPEDFPKLRALGIEQARETAEREAAQRAERKAAAESQNRMFNPFGKP